jgi:hypothetical protein
MRKNNYFIVGSIVVLLFFSGLLIQNRNISAEVAPPYTWIHCSANTTYIDNNLCVYQNCSPKVTKYYSRYTIDNKEFGIQDGLIFGGNSLHFSDDEIAFLTQACSPNISAVLHYINEHPLKKFYNDFYPQAQENQPGEESLIGENWWLYATSPSSSGILNIRNNPLIIMDLLVFIIAIVSAIIFGVLYRKEKKKYQLIGCFAMIILTILFAISLFFLTYVNQMIAAV